jgi:hypothetical protein
MQNNQNYSMNIDDEDEPTNNSKSNSDGASNKYNLRFKTSFPTFNVNQLNDIEPFLPNKIHTLEYDDNEIYRNIYEQIKKMTVKELTIFINNYNRSELYGIDRINYRVIRNGIDNLLIDIVQQTKLLFYDEKQIGVTNIGDVIIGNTSNQIQLTNEILITGKRKFDYPFRIIDYKYDFQRSNIIYKQTGRFLVILKKFEPLDILYSIFKLLYNAFNITFDTIERVLYNPKRLIVLCKFLKAKTKNFQINIIFPNKMVLTLQDSLENENNKYVPPFVLLIDEYEEQISINELIYPLILISHTKLRDATISFIKNQQFIQDIKLSEEMFMNNQNLERMKEMDKYEREYRIFKPQYQ